MVNIVTTDNNVTLVAPIQDSKIKNVAFQMDKFSAAGPDGFGTAFFKIIGILSKMNFTMR